MRTLRVLSLALLPIAMFSACGGGGGSISNPPAAPVFTSTPSTAASQDQQYSYQVAATDPAGGTVSFSLTQAPSGATLTGNTLNWTPPAAQSRIANNFTVKATTSKGGVVSQSWTVSPTGTVTLTAITTSWGPDGTRQVPFNPSTAVFALVPQPDGSFVSIPATQNSSGAYTIPNVPAGYYWLMSQSLPIVSASGYWTSTSNFDGGSDLAASLFTSVFQNTQTTTFDFNLTGLDPAATTNNVIFLTDNFGVQTTALPGQTGASTLNTSLSFMDRQDWSQISSAFLLQMEPVSAGPLNLMTLGPELTLLHPNFVSGATDTINASLQPVTPASVDLNIAGTQWASLFQNIAPVDSPPFNSWYSIQAKPFYTGQNSKSSRLAPNLLMVAPSQSIASSFSIGACPDTPFAAAPVSLPPVTSDQDFGQVAYNDPFPSSWERVLTFCEQTIVHETASVGGNTVNLGLPLIDSVSTVPSSASIVPLALPVLNPTINGTSLFTASTLNTTGITLSWTAPSGGTHPFGYSVQVVSVTGTSTSAQLTFAGTFYTAKTSITLPPLSAGTVYLFMISSEVDGAANMETSPNRSALPTGYARVVSAPITIADGATGPVIH